MSKNYCNVFRMRKQQQEIANHQREISKKQEISN